MPPNPIALVPNFMQRVPGPWHFSLLIRRMFAKNLHAMEYDPHVQYRFHQFFMFAWAGAIVAMPFFKHFYNHDVGILIVQEISFYANFATDFGAMSAALAAGNFHCPGCTCQTPKTPPGRGMHELAAFDLSK